MGRIGRGRVRIRWGPLRESPQTFSTGPARVSVEVGCLGGHGRTRTALACLAVLTGTPANDAVARVEPIIRDRAVETDAQEQFVTRPSVRCRDVIDDADRVERSWEPDVGKTMDHRRDLHVNGVAGFQVSCGVRLELRGRHHRVQQVGRGRGVRGWRDRVRSGCRSHRSRTRSTIAALRRGTPAAARRGCRGSRRRTAAVGCHDHDRNGRPRSPCPALATGARFPRSANTSSITATPSGSSGNRGTARTGRRPREYRPVTHRR